MLGNDARNQHFISQGEQRLNAFNPQAPQAKQRIYSFQVIDREHYTLALENPRGLQIESNLSRLDLFSFDVPDQSRLRLNFEAQFQKYEGNIKAHTESLLSKLNAGNYDVRTEIINLFAAKLLNFIRNPFCIVKVLNTFPGLATFSPTDPALLADYSRIVTGRKPHRTHLCSQLDISEAQYDEWLGVLFMLIVPMAYGQPSFFQDMIRRLLEDRRTYVAAFIGEYDAAGCLLSDRGFSQPIADGPHLGFSFNLRANAFMDFVFVDPTTVVQGEGAPEFITQTVAAWERRPNKELNVTFVRNNVEMLARFNRRAVEQCYERVYCSVKDGIVLTAPSFEAAASH
jgi:hypothetical protein